VDVTTHHVDPQRTGWNAHETTLNWSNANSAQFGLQISVPVDEQVDAQPLVISAAAIAKVGVKGYPNDVVIVATENNTIYAIDSVTGAILLQRNLGQPVALVNLPGGCNNNSAVVGIDSTPVLDYSQAAMFVVTYTWENNAPVYRLHRINLLDFTDQVPSAIISATQTLSDGTQTSFQPGSQRQRPALLLSSGNVYAGFGSFCDFNSNVSRGWMLGWNAQTLAPLNAGLVDRQSQAQAGNGLLADGNGDDVIVYFMSSVWMSGYGLAADSSGAIYGTTGNSDGSNVYNLPESAIKGSADLTTLIDYFTPSNFAQLDAQDLDFGSGGLMGVIAESVLNRTLSGFEEVGSGIS